MSMNEEEKKAIEIVQGLKVYYDNECLLDEEELEENKTVNNAIDMVLNLLENQQKELEQEKEKNKELENADLTLVYMNGFYDGEKKYKDKIKEIMEDLNNKIKKAEETEAILMIKQQQILQKVLEE